MSSTPRAPATEAASVKRKSWTDTPVRRKSVSEGVQAASERKPATLRRAQTQAMTPVAGDPTPRRNRGVNFDDGTTPRGRVAPSEAGSDLGECEDLRRKRASMNQQSSTWGGADRFNSKPKGWTRQLTRDQEQYQGLEFDPREFSEQPPARVRTVAGRRL